MTWPLYERLPQVKTNINDAILMSFLDYVEEKKLQLYPAQEEAILELIGRKNVILNTPTGSGKSLVATALHFIALSLGKRSVYTCPIKALVNEKFFSLCRDFGPEQVGIITGDAAVNPDAPIICCTAEIIANIALRQGSHVPFDSIIMDEFHYYSDRDRGVAWQIPLITLQNTRFLLMSATLGETTEFEKSLTQLNKLETVTIKSNQRPVPLNFEYSEVPLHEAVEKSVTLGRTPIYIVNFTQRECSEEAQNFLSVDFCTKPEKKLIQQALENTRFTSPYGKEIQKLIKHGIGIHHAGLLPKYRILVEKLAQQGLLKIILGTDTLGVGVNVPIRSVLFTKLCKYDGEKTTILTTRDFQQISGRAGRRGFDTEGFVVVQAPEHIIDNLRQEQKAVGDPKKIKKLVKRKPPEKGFVPWNKDTFTKLVQGQPEALVSRFKVNHSMILNVLSRKNEDGCNAMRNLIRNSHESEISKKSHRKTAFQLFRSLVDRKIINLNPLHVNIDLQEDFSLNHALSLYLLDTASILDKDHVNYSLDLLTLVEAILENPDAILRRQLDLIKTRKMSEMKLEGVEYEDRLLELEKLEYPKPNREFIYNTFNEFAANHPWIGQENIRPKSIAREMYENFYSFSEYVRDYGLQRIEGLLLRYLSDVYKVLLQTVPDAAKTDETYEIMTYLKSMVQQIDSSLLDEWERLKNPNWIKEELGLIEARSTRAEERQASLQAKKEFLTLIRNEVFKVVRALATQDFDEVLTLISIKSSTEESKPWTEPLLKSLYSQYINEEHSKICTDIRARSPKNTTLHESEEGSELNVQQILIDPEENNDWCVEFSVDLREFKTNSNVTLNLKRFGPI